MVIFILVFRNIILYLLDWDIIFEIIFNILNLLTISYILNNFFSCNLMFPFESWFFVFFLKWQSKVFYISYFAFFIFNLILDSIF